MTITSPTPKTRKATKPLRAYCWQGGQIGFSVNVPEGAIELGKSTNHKLLRDKVEVIARHAYDNTLLVSGIPEAHKDDADARLAAVFRFRKELAKRL